MKRLITLTNQSYCSKHDGMKISILPINGTGEPSGKQVTPFLQEALLCMTRQVNAIIFDS